MIENPRFLTSELLSRVPGVHHGFGTRLEPLPAIFEEHWESLRPRWKQVHGVQAAEVTQAAQECGGVDALYGSIPKIPITVMSGDCVPILMTRTDGKRVAAVHAGWRGTQARILEVLGEKLLSEGENLRHWVAAIGPAIGPCCYEVSPELAETFSDAFPRHVKGRLLDLPAMNAEQLTRIGLGEVEILRACTRCSTLPPENAVSGTPQPRFNSYRREGAGARQYSVISLT
ncbi:MAG: polyphenol oxidase family protein [Methylotenera sp.]|nr:polyphenol oxidase family protein [Oligoflexia bacterium]